jgi:hypothetical protein
MSEPKIPNSRLRKNLFKERGTALLMTILILNSIILVALSASKLIVSGVKESGTQSKSTKAYFAAEAGAERMLYEYRKGTNTCGNSSFATSTCVFAKNLTGGGSYNVYWKKGSNDIGSTLVFYSAGTYLDLRRSVEIDFYY